jgi:Putative adhesin
MDRLQLTPARKVALAIGVPLTLAIIGWTGLNAVAAIGQGSYPVRISIPVSDGTLHVAVGGGDLTARPGGGSTAQLTGTMHYSLIKPQLRDANDSIAFNCPLPVGDCGLDGTLAVPAGTALNLSSNGGNLSVSGLTGSVTLHSDGGDVTAQSLTGDIAVSTNGGNILGEDLSGQDLTAHSDGGDVTLTFSQAPVKVSVSTDGGNITVTLPHNQDGYALSTGTNGGNVSTDPSVHVNSNSADVVTLHTDGGDITVTEAAAS